MHILAFSVSRLSALLHRIEVIEHLRPLQSIMLAKHALQETKMYLVLHSKSNNWPAWRLSYPHSNPHRNGNIHKKATNTNIHPQGWIPILCRVQVLPRQSGMNTSSSSAGWDFCPLPYQDAFFVPDRPIRLAVTWVCILERVWKLVLWISYADIYVINQF